MASFKEIKGKKGVSYKVEVSLGYDKSGKKLRKTATFKPDPNMTKKQQEKALQKFMYEFEEKAKNGNIIDGERTTLEEYIGEWVKTAEHQVEQTTLNRYMAVQ